MKEPIDFTNCKRIIGKAYNGANGKKIAIEFHGIQYMVKFPPLERRNRPNFPIPTAVPVNILPAIFLICWEYLHRRRF